MLPKVSVIIPNYEHAPYLRQRIDSVLNQTYQDLELIILDDRSTDNSQAVIETYRNHPKVTQIIFNEINSGGPFNQWKKGIECARGEYIWMAESDDWCEPTLLATLMDGFKNDADCVLAYVQTYTINGSNVIEKTSAHNKLAEYVDGKSYIDKYLVDSCSIWNASMAVFKRDGYFKVSQEFTSFKMCGDWLFYIEMARQGNVFISGRVLNYFRNHDKDVSGKMYDSGKNYLEELRILKILKNTSLITPQRFRSVLLNKYIGFCVFKHKFAGEIIGAIEDAFYNDGTTSHKWYLQSHASIILLKIKVKRRINLILS